MVFECTFKFVDMIFSWFMNVRKDFSELISEWCRSYCIDEGISKVTYIRVIDTRNFLTSSSNCDGKILKEIARLNKLLKWSISTIYFMPYSWMISNVLMVSLINAACWIADVALFYHNVWLKMNLSLSMTVIP